MCDPGCFVPVTDPLPFASSERLKPFLRHRVWGSRFAGAVKDQLGESVSYAHCCSSGRASMRPSQMGDKKARPVWGGRRRVIVCAAFRFLGRKAVDSHGSRDPGPESEGMLVKYS
jgi:hypothetical protein